ncbi:hypothetical protein [Candidatus Protochlamydia phocaeensis]|uniref:hypothetical protein n=1 Tax=Candidatus Protochlamydia phocaeensis TaxID=1414722 RepID=UPI000AEE82F9|nr:hypothetical protein [Candidatus Protochlamydia phocaeensis]
MRFIFNFFFFGILFYLIYLFFPDAFHTLVSWADRTYEFFRDLILQIAGKVHSSRDHSAPPPHQALGALLPIWMFLKHKWK